MCAAQTQVHIQQQVPPRWYIGDRTCKMRWTKMQTTHTYAQTHTNTHKTLRRNAVLLIAACSCGLSVWRRKRQRQRSARVLTIETSFQSKLMIAARSATALVACGALGERAKRACERVEQSVTDRDMGFFWYGRTTSGEHKSVVAAAMLTNTSRVYVFQSQTLSRENTHIHNMYIVCNRELLLSVWFYDLLVCRRFETCTYSHKMIKHLHFVFL